MNRDTRRPLRIFVLLLTAVIGPLGIELTTLAASIEFTKTQLDVPREDAFRLSLVAKATGINVGSYGLRTMEQSIARLTGFVAHNGYPYLASRDPQAKLPYMLLDNGPDDENQVPGMFAITVSTKGWPSPVAY
jgi:hypothetical protein